MTVGSKLMIGFGALTALLATFGANSLYTVARMRDIQNDLAYRQAKNLIDIGRLNSQVEEVGVAERDLLIGAITGDAAELSKSAQEYLTLHAALDRTIADLRPRMETGHSRDLLAAIEEAVRQWTPIHEEVARLCAASQSQDAARVRIASSEPILDRLNQYAGELQQVIEQAQAASAAEGDRGTTRSRWTTWVILTISLFIAACAFVGVRRVVAELRRMASQLHREAGQVSRTAAQVSVSSQTLAQGASEQAASLEETSSTSTEINSMARRNGENAHHAADLMTTAQQQSCQADALLHEMVLAMSDIQAQSGKISKIIKVIDEIAFQTNILALNAAVEAARAGEAGMGFAVVADEVRGLAHRSAEAARETAVLIEESIAKSDGGRAKVDQVAAAIRSVTEVSSRMKQLLDEVKTGSEEQVRGIDQVSTAICQMEQVTQRTAAGAEEGASAGEELNRQSQTLAGVVDALLQMVGEDAVGQHTVSL
jgi:methyl-accepting chemotaxis protein/methyl-accepting chemotaxis protein-1 (serine sensor receptor)